MLITAPNFLVWLIGILALGSYPSCLCSCIVAPGDPPSSEVAVPDALERVDAVFLGRVTNGSVVEEIRFIRREFTLSVIEQWKGDTSANLTVRTGEGGGDCGYKFELGQTYLVYATLGEDHTEYEGYLYTNICTRTGSVYEKVVKADLEFLRAAY